MRWKYGAPPVKKANFAEVQPFIHHPAPNGLAGFVLAKRSMSSKQSGEGEIRKAVVGSPVGVAFRVMDAPRAAIFPLEVKG